MNINSGLFQKAFHQDVVWLRDTGVLERLKYDIKRPPLLIPYPKMRHYLPLVMSQLGPIMIILAVGHILSLPVFFCELMVGRGKKGAALQPKDYTKPVGGEYDQLEIVAQLTLLYYGRELHEYL